MPTQEVIDAKVAIGKAYYLELLEEYREGLLDGCTDYADKEKMICLMECIDALTYYIDDDYTQDIYNKLLRLIGSYSGAGVMVNPYISIPGSTIVMSNDGRPEPIVIQWEDMTLNGATPTAEANQYENSTWDGFKSLMQVGVSTFLVRGTDYDLLAGGGFKLKASGNVPFLYEGGYIQVYNYSLA